MRLNAPLGLKEPVCWSSSSFSVRRPPTPNAPASRSIVGVRRICGSIRWLAVSTSKRVTSSGWSPGDKVLTPVSNHVDGAGSRQLGGAVACARMRLVRFRHGDRIATGAIQTGTDTIQVLAGTFFEDPLPTGETVELDDVLLLAPILPSKVVCVGKNYAAHAAEFDSEVPEEPLLFLKPSTAVIGPGDPDPAAAHQPSDRLRGRARRGDGAAGTQRSGGGRLSLHPRFHLRQRRHPAYLAEDRRSMDPGQGLRRFVSARSVDRDRRRSRPASSSKRV